MRETMTETPLRSRSWLRSSFAWGVYGVIIGVVLEALIAYVIVPALRPDTGIVTQLITQEAQAGVAHSGALALQLYTPDAIIDDAGCLSHTPPLVFSTPQAIQQRYATLPTFALLRHTDIQITWDSAWAFSARQATATSVSIGVLASQTSAGATQYQQIGGLERWEIVKQPGGWRISSFTYNLCG